MATPLAFLVVEDFDDNRPLLLRTLRRKFPDCVCIECRTLEAALANLENGAVAAAVVHRGLDSDGLAIVAELRVKAPALPIVYVSSGSRRNEAIAAGADAFLPYDEWLRLGTVVSDLLMKGA